MGQPWRLLVDGDLSGASNMARDLAVLRECGRGSGVATLRLYGWDPPCLTLGRHQGSAAADPEFCRHHGIDIVRRPTGGRAVLHHLELTYAVIAPLGRGVLPRGLQEAYRLMCGALLRACGHFGIAGQLSSDEVNLQLPGPRSTVPCFKAPAGGEVVVDGRKLIGSAMRAHGEAILQHGAILLDWDGSLQAGAMGLDDDSTLRPHVTTFAEQLGRVPDRQVLERAIAEAFGEELGVVMEPGELSQGEMESQADLTPAFRPGSS